MRTGKKIESKAADLKAEEKPMPLYQDFFKKKSKAKESILRKIKHLLPDRLLDKTPVCKHEHGCFENVVRKALWTFSVGFVISALINNGLLLLTSPRKFLMTL